MDEECSFDVIPNELILKVLESSVLSYEDVKNVSFTCGRLNKIIFPNNQLWKIKFFQTYPRISREPSQLTPNSELDWYSELRLRCEVGTEIRSKLDDLGTICKSVTFLCYKHYAPFIELCERYQFGTLYVIDELMNVVSIRGRNSNLTRRYYGLKILRHIRQYWLSHGWSSFFNEESNDEGVLESAACFLSQWFFPDVDTSFTAAKLAMDNLANDVLEHLRTTSSGRHPVLKVDKETRRQWRDNNLTDNKWSPEECRQIIRSTSAVIYGLHGFTVVRCMYKKSPLTIELEKKVCDPLSMSIVFEGVARRLGVKCDLICFSCHYLLGWTESYEADDDIRPAYFIDTIDKGTIIRREGFDVLPADFKSLSMCTEAVRVDRATLVIQYETYKMYFSWMQNQTHTFNHVGRLQSILELVVLIAPKYLNNYILLLDFYDSQGIEVDPAFLDKLYSMVHNFTEDEKSLLSGYIAARKERLVTPHKCIGDDPVVLRKRRSESNVDVKYAIGLVMQHKMYGYKCVIYGWDSRCSASPNWIKIMRVHRLKHKQFQPFYNVLVDDGSLRYAAQENLVLVDQDTEISSVPEVGRHFKRWCGRYYEPTEHKNDEYPDDAPVRQAILESNPIQPDTAD